MFVRTAEKKNQTNSLFCVKVYHVNRQSKHLNVVLLFFYLVIFQVDHLLCECGLGAIYLL